MGFLQRSKSAAVTEQITKKDIKKSSEVNGFVALGGEEKTSTSYERPKTADHPASFSRPRTANAAIGRSTEFRPPSFRIDFKAGDEIFSFPTPSPCLPPPKSAFRQNTPSTLREPELPAIGLAIGSPTHIDPWQDPVVEECVVDLMPAPLRPTRPAPAVPEHPDLEMPLTDIKKKKANWKTLGGLFGRKAAKSASQQSTVQGKDDNLNELIEALAQNPPPKPPPHHRSPSLTRGQARFEARCEADRSFLPTNQPKLLRSPSMIQKEGLSPMFRSIQGIPEDSAWVDDLRKDSPLSMMMSSKPVKSKDDTKAVAVPGTPTLVLDLPDPKFERYSIMFEKVLEDSKPSLLERRQSKLKRNASVKKLELSNINYGKLEVPRLEVNGVPERSATSPGLTKSLSTRIGKKLLSPVSEAFSSLNRPHPVRRAKTVAAPTASPSAKGFPNNSKSAPQSASPSSAILTDSPMPLTPMTITTISDSGSVEVISNDVSIRRNIEKSEPCWDMMTSVPFEDCRSPVDFEKHIVQLSVAKRISMSKAVTQLRKSGDVKQALRPKVVELGRSHASTFVVIETIEE